MKKTKRIVSFLMAVGMTVVSVLPASAYEKPANAEEVLSEGYSSDEDAYAIYPIPQSTTYTDGTFQLDDQVQVVIEDDVDTYTEAFLEEILEDYGHTEKETNTITGTSQILLGIEGSGGLVDTWADNNVQIEDADLFEQRDSYLLSAKNGTIVILGRDTDAVYYGLATLQMMFSSFNGEKFLNVQIEDYATMKMRGFIEGFYGGWDYESRESLMRFARDVKMNTYIYASKTDTYHTSATLYPADELAKIKELVQVGEETKVRYGWSMHIAYFFNSLSSYTVGTDAYETAFQEQYEKLEAKFQQLYDVGVRKFAILNDDFGSGTHAEVVRLLNKLDDEFLTPKGCQNLTYCMQGYNKSWSTSSELQALQNLNDSIDLFWTGDDVNSPITQETVDYVKAQTGHDAVFWLNYPVNEHAKSGVYLGNITHYARDGVTGLAGAMSNPSRYAEANKVGLFQLASLFWNNNDYLENADTIWEESFKYLQPEVYQAYLTIARNVANCPNSSRVTAGFPESEYIKDALEAVTTKLQKGQSISDDENAKTLLAEFGNMLTAVETFRSQCSNTELISELDPWLNSLTDVATAGQAALKALFALEEGDAAEAWSDLAIAGKAMDTQDTYPAYDGATNMALAGSKRLVPFVTKAVSAAKNQLIPYLNPTSTDFTATFIGVIGGSEQSASTNTAKMLDGDSSTYAAFSTNQQVGDYYGVDLGRVIDVNSIEIIQAKDDTHNDYFHNAVLEYSTDGETWTQIGDVYKDAVTIQEQVEIKARFIRLRLTQIVSESNPSKTSYWTNIREFTINGGNQEEASYGVYATDGNVTGQVTLDERTYTWTAEGTVSLAAGESIGVKLGDLSGIESVSLSGTGTSDLTLRYSENSAVWKDAPDSFSGESARYVCLYNGTGQTVNFNLNSLAVTVDSIAINPQVIDSSFSTLKEGSWENLFDGNESTYIWTNTAQQNGQYILVDLGVAAPVYDLTITTLDGNPRFYNAEIQVSTDKSNWETIATVTDGGGDAVREDIYYRIKKELNGKSVRYLKILVTGNTGYYLRINEIAINKTQGTESDTKVLTGNLSGDLEKMTDGDISTVYTSDAVSDGTAYVKYQLTENTKLTSLTFLQDAAAITNAVVTAEVYDGSEVKEETLGTLDSASTTFYRRGDDDVLSVTITWPAGTTPSIYEIIPVTGETVYEVSFPSGTSDGTVICPSGRSILLPETTEVKEGYTFKGWSDGTEVYAPGSRYIVSKDVTMTPVWEEEETKPNETESDKTDETGKTDETDKKDETNGGQNTVTTPIGSTTNPTTPTQEAVKEGESRVVNGYTYKVTSLSGKTVEVTGTTKTGTAIKVPATVKIGETTFKVTSVGKNAFKNNKKATSVTIGKNVETIGSSAFAGCVKVKKVTIQSKKLKEIGSKAFSNNKALKKLTLKTTALKKVGSKAFKGINKKAVIKVPASKVKAYKKLLAKKGQSKTVSIK